ncbi:MULTISPECIES: DUF6287 domain-containing protein [Aerococcus]|uniref:DUF6287 domain-containing protein n=1 Tax=Aerococcus tenax TaxID=3078812 RepID=A0A5N1BP78_9LACT|nr:DUF6287 domain-containing protein [Aerococcus urinae]KAA9240381.1 hypothetical protein F6I34_04835 [Aerococcus urinae]MDK7302753.1 DUF6287 domain-containing protein [Aerococcus urinae]MDK7801463.1 DUF6287 domain-containing protein [Aerococcus urinae]MDK8654997.1 DUF6287 domain-containing protein [Aerococcus urinae]RAV70793.1 hypothetical protein DBT40_06220 [Aerococcus urinae]
MKKAKHKLLPLTALLTLALLGCQNNSEQSTATSQSQESVSSESSSEKEEAKEKESSKEESESKKEEENSAKEEKAESESQAEETESESSANESSVPTIAGDLGRTTSQQGLDIDQIMQGDLTTLVGTWRNEKGQEFVFHEDGSVDPDYYLNLDNFRLENQTLVGDLRGTNSYGGVALHIIPAGVVMVAPPMLDIVDASDYSRDRLLATQTYGTMEIPEEFYYRVD